jgi:soluble lytic murein transglycosylase
MNISRRHSDQSPLVNQLLEQVEVLRKYSFDSSSRRVLNWTIAAAQEAEPEVRIYLAELKRDQGDYQSKISILSDVLYKNPQLISKESMELYFPKVYFPVFEKNVAGIDPYLLISIARQESAFNAKARSHANARGLMQMLPMTARRFSSQPSSKLYVPEFNVSVGSRYFTTLLERTNGQIHLALAAYNAGENRITQWTQRYPVQEPVLFIDLIPFRETRDYVASILRNYYWYRRIHSNSEPTTNSLFSVEAKKDSTTVQ